MYGLVGYPLGHSFSPSLHKMLWNCDNYALFSLEEDAAKQFFKNRNFSGVNVTIPYKKLALASCDVVDERAAKIGAVNTVVNKGGILHGYNTDYSGLMWCIKRADIEVKGQKVLILGSGATSGTAKAVIEDMGAREIVIISRSGEHNYDNIDRHSDCDVIVNTTPVGMSPNVEGMAVDPANFPLLKGVVDVVYNPLETALVARAKSLGIKAVTGLAMLVGQAAEAAEHFSGSVIEASRTEECLDLLDKSRRNIVIVGMPGSGKTTVGRLVADMLNREFLDLDEDIENHTGMFAGDIIERHGEPHFREIESERMKLAGLKGGIVIATGGGTVLKEQNRQAMRQNGRVYFLKRDIKELATEGRPLSKGGALEQMWEMRRPIYEEVCDVELSGASASEVASVIAKEWQE